MPVAEVTGPGGCTCEAGTACTLRGSCEPLRWHATLAVCERLYLCLCRWAEGYGATVMSNEELPGVWTLKRMDGQPVDLTKVSGAVSTSWGGGGLGKGLTKQHTCWHVWGQRGSSGLLQVAQTPLASREFARCFDLTVALTCCAYFTHTDHTRAVLRCAPFL